MNRTDIPDALHLLQRETIYTLHTHKKKRNNNNIKNTGRPTLQITASRNTHKRHKTWYVNPNDSTDIDVVFSTYR